MQNKVLLNTFLGVSRCLGKKPHQPAGLSVPAFYIPEKNGIVKELHFNPSRKTSSK